MSEGNDLIIRIKFVYFAEKESSRVSKMKWPYSLSE
jgi:hypothetical protein